MEMLDKYHGQASGIFSCSEHLAGTFPSQGTELCTVVETIFSYITIFSVFGNISDADRIESLVYNALPAAIDPYMWAHNYLQQIGNFYYHFNIFLIREIKSMLRLIIQIFMIVMDQTVISMV